MSNAPVKSLMDIDPNFKLPESIPENMSFYEAYDAPFSIHGVAPNERGVLCRLPVSFLPECNDGVKWLAYYLSGACVRFSTDADQLAVVWEITGSANMPQFAPTGQSGMELFEETDEGSRHIKVLAPALESGHGCRLKQSTSLPLPGGMRHYALYLPLYNGLTQLMLGFPQGAQILPGRMPKIEKPIVFYGSSITQGGCVTKTGSTYASILARRLDAALVNLGFSGNGKGEANMAEYIATLPMSLFVLDYDHNAPTTEYLQETHERFFQIIRQAQPELPIVIMSRPDFDLKPEDSVERRAVIRKTYENALAKGDRHVAFVDGETLFGDTDRDLCTMDDVHPNDLGALRIADRLEPVLRSML